MPAQHRHVFTLAIHLTAGAVIVAASLAYGQAPHALAINTASRDAIARTAGTEAGLRTARWGANVSVSFENGQLRYRSNGVPNHARQAEYALPQGRGPGGPGGGGGGFSAMNFAAGADPTREQAYDFKIPLEPKRAATPTPTNLGTIGVMISGAALFNPYEGDGRTIAMAGNFTVKNAAGADIAFLDACNGHPTPFGAYHYHALPPCVTAMVDVAGGPSHIIGVAFDGYPIYGDRDNIGRQLTEKDLDACGGINSATPEYPAGIYHYVLLQTTTAASSIRCFSGEVSISAPRGMPGMPGMRHP